MPKANIPRLRQVYQVLQQHPGSTIGELARHARLSYETVQAMLPTLDNQGFYLTEDQQGKLYPFAYCPEIPPCIVDPLLLAHLANLT